MTQVALSGPRSCLSLDQRTIDSLARKCLETMARRRIRMELPEVRRRYQTDPCPSGVYCIWSQRPERLIYVGQSRELQSKRVGSLWRLTAHTFARKYAMSLGLVGSHTHSHARSLSALSPQRCRHIESGLAEAYARSLLVGWIEISFGRTEIEEALIKMHRDPVLNS